MDDLDDSASEPDAQETAAAKHVQRGKATWEPTQQQTHKAAAILFAFMDALVCSHSNDLAHIKAVPGFTQQETKARITQRYLLAWKRGAGRTTQCITRELGELFESALATMSFHEALVAVLATWGVWRLGGNTIAWCMVAGKIYTWDSAAKARVQSLWYKACYTFPVSGNP